MSYFELPLCALEQDRALDPISVPAARMPASAFGAGLYLVSAWAAALLPAALYIVARFLDRAPSDASDEHWD